MSVIAERILAMINKKTILITLLALYSCLSFAQTATQEELRRFTFLNKSRCKVYVWVTAIRNMYVPEVTNVPYMKAIILPGSTARVNFAYTLWDRDTRLTFQFCTTSSRSCLGSGGSYTGFSISPKSEQRWGLKADWLSILWPYPILDNIIAKNNSSWNRNAAPAEIVFKDWFTSRSARRTLKCPQD